MKAKTTRRALLMSALSLLLCVSMLIGSTFAWFTDSVTSGNNIIQSGTLDVEMKWVEGTENPVTTADWKDASKGAIFDYDLWEPGYAEVRHIQIKNAGTLALKYQLSISANGEVSKLSDAIDVYYLDPAQQISERTGLTADKKLGTLTEVLAAINTSASGELKAGESHTITLALKMRETAGNEYQGLSIGSDFAIQVMATQLTSEFDSFDNQYDAAATYLNKDASGNWLITNAGELLYFAQQVNSGNNYRGETILLANDVDLKNMNWQPIGSPAKGFCGTFDGQEHTISNFKVEQEEYAGLFGYMLNGGNVKNLTVKGATIKATDRAGAVLGAGYTDVVNCHAVDCEITVIPALQANGEFDGGAKAGGVVGQLFEGAGISIVGCTAKNVKVTGYRDIGAVLGMAHNNNTVTDCAAYDSEVAFYYLEDGQNYDGNTPNENIGEVVGRRNPGVVESNTHFERVVLKVKTLEITVNDAASLEAALNAITGPTIINATGVVVELTAAVPYEIPADVTLKGATFKAMFRGMNYITYIGNSSKSVTFDDCTFGTTSRVVVLGGTENGPTSVIYNNCTFTGQVLTNYVDNLDGVAQFNNCKFTKAEVSVYNFIEAMGGTHNFNDCTFDYSGVNQTNMGVITSGQINVYSESEYSTKVVLTGCTRINCGTRQYGPNSTLTIK